MAAEISISRKRKPDGFMSVLSYAACEWFLMLLLFVDAAFSYLLLKFAWYCELEAPCQLCSRFDHGFGKKKPSLCWSLLCNDHREEISSLVSCSVHSRFADVHSLCEECLTSINMQRKYGSPENMICSCCRNTLRAKSSTERLMELDPIGFGASRANIRPPLPRTPCSSRFSRRDSLKRLREKFAGKVTDGSAWGNSATSVGADTMSNVAYTKLKLSSDSESEFAHESEDDDEGNTDVEHILHEPQSDSNAVETHKDNGFEEKPLVLDQPKKLEEKNVDPLPSDENTEHFVELDGEGTYYKRSTSLRRKLISLCDSFSPRSDAVGAFAEKSESNISLPHMPAISVPSEVISVCSVPPLSNDTTPEKQDEQSEANHTDDTHLPEKNDAQHVDASTNDAEALELSSRNAFEATKIEKDVAEVSTSDLGSMSEETSHGGDRKVDESRIGEDSSSSSSSSQVLREAASSENKDSSYITKAEMTVTDIEGENIVDQLKRQIEHDHKCLNSLYKELEEERNAAAISAEEAMAMITRLQEEKAALRMEALHYLRMMEEQAAYDTQALERANDLLAERERELQDLEYELESYRNNYNDEPEEDDVQETSDQDN